MLLSLHMSSGLKLQNSVPQFQTEYIDSDGKTVDLSEAIWMVKVALPYINIQEIYRKIQDEVIFHSLFFLTIHILIALYLNKC